MQWIYPLDRVDLTHVQHVGGKAARLGAMAQAGFDVPEGFVIAADAFRAHLPNCEADQRPAPPRLQSEFVSVIADAIGRHFPPQTQFAVRSSCVDEDSAATSFAGQHDTYYFIDNAHIGEAVVDCWLSLWSEQALAYRRTWGSELQPMAVIVQRMVRADRAGVSFSQDPNHPGSRRTVIESTWGLGAALVDGHVSPDRTLVDRRGRVTHTRIGDKRVYIPGDQQGGPSGRLAAVAHNQRDVATLSQQDAERISETTQQIRTLFGHPVDVEWAFEDDNLRILQARPITATSTQPEERERLVLFKPVAENFSDPLTPLSEDLFRRVLPRIGHFVRGRFYLKFDLLRPLLPFKLDDAALADLMLLRTIDPPAISPRKLPRTLALLAALYLANGVFWLRSAHVTERVLENVDALTRAAQEDQTLDALTAFKRLLHGRHPLQAIHHFVFQINMSAGRYFVLLSVLNRLLARWAPMFDTNAIPNLCHGGNDMLSTRMVEAIADLATLASEDDGCRAALTSPSALEELARLDEEHPFLVALESFLNSFGHRGSREIELAAPRWQEDVGALLVMIRSQLEVQDRPADNAYARHLAARDQLHQALPSRWKRRIVDRLVSRIRYYIVLRENTRHYHTKLFDLVRNKLLMLENDLLATDRLRVSGDIFYLTWDELQDLRTGAMNPIEASQLVRTRRVHWQAAASLPPPDRYGIQPTKSASAEGTLQGVCACPGTASGTARVILHPRDADRLQPGDILVAPYTDPTWTPLFPALGGIVVELGSYLSHAGTIAREYQIPCIVDVTGCVARIQDGDLLTIDAANGVVVLPEESE